MHYAVVHVVRVGTRVAQRRVRLVITGVPERTPAEKVIEVLETAGRAVDFSEAGVRWGNHEVRDAEHLPAGTTDLDTAENVAWSSMVDDREIRRITLRLPAELYADVVLAAARADLRLQGWCEAVLRHAAAEAPATSRRPAAVARPTTRRTAAKTSAAAATPSTGDAAAAPAPADPPSITARAPRRRRSRSSADTAKP